MKELIVKVLENAPLADGIYKLKVFAARKNVLSALWKIRQYFCGRQRAFAAQTACDLRIRREERDCLLPTERQRNEVALESKGGRIAFVRSALGNGFTLEENEKRIALVGGGVGVFPMISVLREFENSDKRFYSYMGFRNRGAVCMEETFRTLSEKSEIVTDDGSYQKRGNAVSAFF